MKGRYGSVKSRGKTKTLVKAFILLIISLLTVFLYCRFTGPSIPNNRGKGLLPGYAETVFNYESASRSKARHMV